jgi:hypothetical protein
MAAKALGRFHRMTQPALTQHNLLCMMESRQRSVHQ